MVSILVGCLFLLRLDRFNNSHVQLINVSAREIIEALKDADILITKGGWNIRYHLMDDVKAFLKGQLPKSIINPEVLDSVLLRFLFKRKNN